MIASPPRREGAGGPAAIGPHDRSLVGEGFESPGIRTHELGRSEEDRPIEVALRGPEPGELRVLVLAGQHGDEPWARIAVRRWIAPADHDAIPSSPHPPITCVALLDANPDGSRRHRRRNAHDVDLNRDHLLLEAPETRAIHEAVRRYSPHLIVDAHNFPSRRRHLLAQGWTIGADVQLAGATHPAIRTSMTAADEAGLFDRIQSDLAALGYTAVPYTLFRPSGKARPSTLRVRDARNSLSLRYGIPTILLEGRDPGRQGPVDAGLRTAGAQFAALRSIEAWASEHREKLLRGPPIPAAGESVRIEARWAEEGEPRSVPLERTGSGELVHVRWVRFAGGLRVRHGVTLPRAYAVRNDLNEVHAVLARHGLDGDRIVGPSPALVESVRPSEFSSSRIERATGASPSPVPFAFDLSGYTRYSVHQRAGRALAVWLEGGPRTGLAAFRAACEPARTGERPPILRVMMWDYPKVRFGPAPCVGDDPQHPFHLGSVSPPFRSAFGAHTPGARGRGWIGPPRLGDASRGGGATLPANVRPTPSVN